MIVCRGLGRHFAAFREWLLHYTSSTGDAGSFDSLMQRLSHVKPGRRFTRDEMNAR